MCIRDRYMIWENILPESTWDEWKKAADKIDGINPHIIEDIQDYIIRQAYPDTEAGKKELEEVKRNLAEEVKKKLNDEKEEVKKSITVEKKLEAYRPHVRVWNFFLDHNPPQLENHTFRIDADPFNIYADGRVEQLWELIKGLEVKLKLSDEQAWNSLIMYVFEILTEDQKNEEEKEMNKIQL
eukprot:TRINITY_DN1429_c0_g1_i3.p2 TRINITY_DN1429_c0_g1~~TRINITY_DN1429_c0_g1_i3.p2  ORF type:complete len:183 (-),score=46.42 TRINITY_DN1429_c0_g1_i3:43-591(-)